jgi:hypothetical protein
MIDMYYMIPQVFAQGNAGYIKGENQFNYAITIDDRFVCSANSREEFPELFAPLESDGWHPLAIPLTLADFPQPPTPEI